VLNDFGSHCLAATFVGGRPAFALADGTVRRIGGEAEADCVRVHADASLAAARVAGDDALLTSGEDGRVCRLGASGEARSTTHLPQGPLSSTGGMGRRLPSKTGCASPY